MQGTGPKSAAPIGKTFGYADVIDYFEALNTTSSRSSSTIAAVTPTRQFREESYRYLSPQPHQQTNVQTCTIATQQYQQTAQSQRTHTISTHKLQNNRHCQHNNRPNPNVPSATHGTSNRAFKCTS